MALKRLKKIKPLNILIVLLAQLIWHTVSLANNTPLSNNINKKLGSFKKTVKHQATVISVEQIQLNNRDFLLSTDKNGKVILWDLVIFKGVVLYNFKSSVTAVDYNQDKGLFALSFEGDIKIFKLGDDKELYSLNDFPTEVSDMAFFKGDQQESLLLAGKDGIVYRWLYRKPRQVKSTSNFLPFIERYIRHNSPLVRVLPHPFGRVFFSLDWNGLLIAWQRYDADILQGEYDENKLPSKFFSDIPNAKEIDISSVGLIEGGDLSQDGYYLLAYSQQGKVVVFKTRGLIKQIEFSAHNKTISSLALKKDNSRKFFTFATSDREGKIKLWKFYLNTKKQMDKKMFFTDTTTKSSIEYLGSFQYYPLVLLEFFKGYLIAVRNDNSIALIKLSSFIKKEDKIDNLNGKK